MADMWEGVAPAWERNAEHVDRHLTEPTQALLDAAGISAGSAVLEVAAGPGGAGLAAAARAGTGGSVVLTDAAPGMVAAARRRATGLTQVSARVSDQLTLDAADGTFDAVVSRHGLMFVEPPADAVREAARVLRPGGRYAAMVWAERQANPWLGLVLDAVGEQFGVPFPPPGIAGPFSLGDEAVLTRSLRDGGLDEITVERLPAPMRLDSLETWWGLVPELAGPLASALAGMEPEVRDAIRDRALAGAGQHARRTADGVELDGAVLIGAGCRP